MNKLRGLVVLGSALFLFGCGGGGTTTTSSNIGGGGSNPTAVSNPGYVTINFSQAPKSNQVIKAASSPTLPTANWVRVVIRNFGTYVDENDNTITYTTYKDVEDFDLSATTSATIPIPQANGYRIDVISYYKTANNNALLKLGSQVDVNITAGITTSVTINMALINAQIALPSSIISGTPYSATVTTGGFPLTGGNLRVSSSAIVDAPAYSSTIFGALTQTGASLPVGSVSITQYFQGIFFLDAACLKATDSQTLWTYYYPNPSYGDPAVSATLLSPGGIDITINP